MKKSYIIGALIVVAAIIIFITLSGKTSAPTVNPPAPNSGEQILPGDQLIVSMTDDAFLPSKLTIKQNQTITFINNGTRDHWPASDIHPTHGIYPQFDPKRGISPGDSWSFKFDRIGNWRFHDHLNPGVTGIITVQ